MSVARQYVLQAAEGREQDLQAALGALAAQVRGCAGCEKVEIFADAKDALSYVFIEHWRGAEDRDAAGAKLGKAAFAPVFETLGGRPEARDLLPFTG